MNRSLFVRETGRVVSLNPLNWPNIQDKRTCLLFNNGDSSAWKWSEAAHTDAPQSPHSDGITEKNKLIIDDEHYLKGYKRGAKSTSTWEAVKGGLIGTGALFLVAAYGMSQVP